MMTYILLYVWIASATYLAVAMLKVNPQTYEKVILVVFWPVLLPTFLIIKILEG